MKRKIENLKNYLDALTADMGWQIIINDYYGIFRPYSVIAGYISDKNWHNNPYCLAIKKNDRLWERCVKLKTATRRNIKNRAKPGWNICYCGVAEYTLPIFSGGVHIATVCAAGFFAPLSAKMTEILSRRTEIPECDFIKLHETALRQREEGLEERLCAYLMPVAEIIEELARSNPLVKSGDDGKIPDEKQKYVLLAMDHIEKHYFDDITPESVAKRCHISLSYLQHLFLSFTGQGIASVIRRKRLQEACRLLAETDRSVKNIAISCGFYDTDYFSVIFRRSYGISPLGFRKSRTGNG